MDKNFNAAETVQADARSDEPPERRESTWSVAALEILRRPQLCPSIPIPEVQLGRSPSLSTTVGSIDLRVLSVAEDIKAFQVIWSMPGKRSHQ